MGSPRARGEIFLRRSEFSEENHVELNSEKLPEGPVGKVCPYRPSHLKHRDGDFPGGPVVESLPSNAGDVWV